MSTFPATVPGPLCTLKTTGAVPAPPVAERSTVSVVSAVAAGAKVIVWDSVTSVMVMVNCFSKLAAGLPLSVALIRTL